MYEEKCAAYLEARKYLQTGSDYETKGKIMLHTAARSAA